MKKLLFCLCVSCLCVLGLLVAARAENAAPHYEAAFSKMDTLAQAKDLKKFPFSYLGDVDWDKWSWLGADHGILADVRLAASMDDCQFIPVEQVRLDTKIPYAEHARQLNRFLCARGALAFQVGDYALARECYLLDLKFAHHLLRQETEIVVVIGISFETLASKGLMQFALAPASEQAKLQTALRELLADRPPLAECMKACWDRIFPSVAERLTQQMSAFNVDQLGEEPFMVWLVEGGFPDKDVLNKSLIATTRSGYENMGRIVSSETYPAAKLLEEELTPDSTGHGDMPTILGKWAEMLKLINASDESLAAIKAGGLPAEKDRPQIVEGMSSYLGTQTAATTCSMMYPLTVSMLSLNLESLMYLDMVSLHLALGQYHDAKGTYPHSLDELVPDYLPNVPMDPFTEGEPLRYALEDDGYVFYSIGEDMKDDGGETQYPYRGPDTVERLSDYPRKKPPPPPKATGSGNGDIFAPVKKAKPRPRPQSAGEAEDDVLF